MAYFSVYIFQPFQLCSFNLFTKKYKTKKEQERGNMYLFTLFVLSICCISASSNSVIITDVLGVDLFTLNIKIEKALAKLKYEYDEKKNLQNISYNHVVTAIKGICANTTQYSSIISIYMEGTRPETCRTVMIERPINYQRFSIECSTFSEYIESGTEQPIPL